MKKRAFMSIVNSLKGFIRKISGTPPITLPYCVDDDSLIRYSLEGNGVGDKTKNLFDMSSATWTGLGTYTTTTNSISIVWSDGAGAYRIANHKFYYNSPYVFSWESSGKSRVVVRFFDANGNNISENHAGKITGGSGAYNIYYKAIYKDITDNIIKITYTDNTDIAYFQIGFVGMENPVPVEYSNIQITEGTTAKEYEPFGYKIPIKMSGKNLATAKEIYSFGKQYSDFVYEELNEDGRECIRFVDNRGVYYKGVSFKENTQYTVSFDVKTTIKTTDVSRPSIVFAFHYVGGTNTRLFVPRDTDWHRVQLTSEKGKTVGAIGLLSNTYSNWIYIDVNTFQLEESATATDYEPYINPITTNIILDEPLIAGNVLEYPKEDIPKLPTVKGTTIYSVETEVQPTNMSVEYYATRKGE